MCVCVCICVHPYMHACVCICVHPYMHACVCMYVHIHTCEYSLQDICCSLQHASSDVERLLVGNKCDLESQRAIPYDRGEQVSSVSCDLVGHHGRPHRWQKHRMSVTLKQVQKQITILMRYVELSVT